MADSDELESRNHEALLVEYQALQEAANNETSGYWAFAGIFLGLSAVLLGAVVAVLFSRHSYVRFGIIATVLTIGMWVVYGALLRMLDRANATQELWFRRMRDIERATNMAIRQQHSHGISGRTLYNIILKIFSLFWLLILVLAWAGRVPNT